LRRLLLVHSLVQSSKDRSFINPPIPSLIRRLGLTSRQWGDLIVRELDLCGSRRHLLVAIEEGSAAG